MTRGEFRRAALPTPDPDDARQVPSQDVIDALGEAVRRARAASAHGIPTEPPATGRTRRSARPSDVRPPPSTRQPDPDEARVITNELPAVEGGSHAPMVFVDNEAPGAPTPARVARRRDAAPGRFAPPWLVRGVGVAAAIAVLLGAADVALLVSGNHPAQHGGLPALGTKGPGSTVPPITTTRPSPTTSAPTTTTAVPTTTTAAPTTTTSAGRAGGGTGAPRLTSISPPHGHAGSVVAVGGSNLFSPSNGVIVARVDGQPAATNCPSQTSCQVTIPSLGRRPTTVAITVTTDSGTSNAVSFRYV